jgi:hypothetical protein
MSIRLEVRMSASTGMPCTCVPSHAMWELVEYLAAHRTAVLYGYSAQGFTVTFQRLDCAAAQALLDAWKQRREPDLDVFETSAKEEDELCYFPG